MDFETAEQIRKEYEGKKVRQWQLAKKYGLSPLKISRIVNQRLFAINNVHDDQNNCKLTELDTALVRSKWNKTLKIGTRK